MVWPIITPEILKFVMNIIIIWIRKGAEVEVPKDKEK